MPSAATWKDLKISISEVKSERGRKIPYDITYIWNLNMTEINTSTKQKRLTEEDKRLAVAKGEVG